MSQSLTPLDIATGTMLGCERRPAPLPDIGGSPRDAIERAILPALLRPPCLVSFSGGRDSSAVLAVATALARREGLDLPIPATNVFPRAEGSDETEWQVRVVDHLRLDDWVRLEHDEELDVVGPYARRVMREHGLLLPCNVHFHLPLLDAAAGGSLLTGVGGDELFAAAQAPVPVLRGRPRRQAPRRLADRALSYAPHGIRRAARRRAHPLSLPWLRPEAARRLSAQAAAVAVREPRRLPERLAWWRDLRYLGDGTLGLSLIAASAGARIFHPLLDRLLWGAVARSAGPVGFTGRTHGMTALFGDLLPGETRSRRTKAHFDGAMWTRTAERFARGWDGTGVPPEVVDIEALRRHWAEGEPSAASFGLLQSAWLAGARAEATRRDRAQEGVHGALV